MADIIPPTGPDQDNEIALQALREIISPIVRSGPGLFTDVQQFTECMDEVMRFARAMVPAMQSLGFCEHARCLCHTALLYLGWPDELIRDVIYVYTPSGIRQFPITVFIDYLAHSDGRVVRMSLPKMRVSATFVSLEYVRTN